MEGSATRGGVGNEGHGDAGRPILILATIVPVAALSVLFHGPTLEDLAFLIWWDRGKGK